MTWIVLKIKLISLIKMFIISKTIRKLMPQKINKRALMT